MKRTFVFCVLGLTVLTVAQAEIRYRVTRIDPPRPAGPPGVMSMAGLDINNRGQVVGEFNECLDAGCWTQRLGAFFYSQEAGTVELVLSGYVSVSATGINEAGQIAVSSATRDRGWRDMFRYTPGLGYEEVPNLGGLESEVWDINAYGQVTGFSDLSNSVFEYAIRNRTGEPTENLGELLPGYGSVGTAINDHGWVVGGSAEHAFLYRDDLGMMDLGPGTAYDINNAGVAVGRYVFEEGNPHSPEEACLWKDGQLRLLGPSLPPVAGGNTLALGINDDNVVVGTMFPWARAFLWTEVEGMVDLNTLVERSIPGDPASVWYFMSANAINNHGQIVGAGGVGNATNRDLSTAAVTFRLDPIPPRLNIRHGSTNLMVSWTPSWPGLALETTTSLSAPDWQALATGGTNVVSVPPDGPQRFFRLNLEGIRGLCCAPEK